MKLLFVSFIIIWFSSLLNCRSTNENLIYTVEMQSLDAAITRINNITKKDVREEILKNENEFSEDFKNAQKKYDNNLQYAKIMRIAGRASGIVGGSTAAATAQSNPTTAAIAGAIAGIGSLLQWLLGDEGYADSANKCGIFLSMKNDFSNLGKEYGLGNNDKELNELEFNGFKQDLINRRKVISGARDLCLLGIVPSSN